MSDDLLSELLARSVEHLPMSELPVVDLLAQGRLVRRRRRRLAVGMAAVVGVLVVGAVAVGQGFIHRDVPVASQPQRLPAAPVGMKWVGVGRTVVAVPRSWPVLPGIYCQGPSFPYVTLTKWHAAPSCAPLAHPRPMTISASVDIEGNSAGGFSALLEGPTRSSGFTQRTLDASRTRLPVGWLAVPSGEPYGGIGTPTVTSEIAALQASGFHAKLESAAPDGRWRPVTTSPPVGTPARVGSTIVVYDHGAAASSATLRGRLLWVGGPAPGSPVPHRGTVHVVNANDSFDQTVRAGRDGRWMIYLPPGTYRVRATSPGYLSRRGAFDACSASRPVTVHAGGSATANVYCQLR